MIYFEITDRNGNMIAENMSLFGEREKYLDNKNFSRHKKGKGIKSVEKVADGLIIWLVVKDEKDLLGSSRYFNQLIRAYTLAAVSMWQQQKKLIDIHAHSLRTISGQMGQKFEGLATVDQYQAESYRESINKLNEIVKSQPEKASMLLFYLSKRIADLKMHLVSIDLVHNSPLLKVKNESVYLGKCLLSIYAPFAEEFKKISIEVRFHIPLEIKINVDRKMLNLAMHNFFENATKYAMPGSTININFDNNTNKIIFNMKSLRIDKEELSLVQIDGFRGKHARELSSNGYGHGMYVISRALAKINMRLVVSPVYKNSEPYEGRPYVDNIFIIEPSV